MKEGASRRSIRDIPPAAEKGFRERRGPVIDEGTTGVGAIFGKG